MLAARQVNYPPLIPSTNKYAIENIIEARYLSPNEKITALRQVLSEWSSLNLEVAGKSYPDFIRFQIGMIQMQSGDTHTALKTLDSLTLSPTNPITPAISLAAQAYLTHYQKSGDIYHACREALNSMSQLLPFETLGSPFSEFSEKQFLQAWGYVPYSSYNASVCNLEVFLPMLLQSWNIDSLAELPDLLQQADVPIKASEYVDLDGDGINDWLMLIEIDEPTQTNNSYSFWAFLAEGERISAVFVQKIYVLDENITSLPITLFHSKDQPRPILFMHLDSKLTIFKVIHTKNGFIVQFVPYTQLSYSVLEYDIRPNEKGFELDVFFKEDGVPDSTSHNRTATFAWDIPSQRFVTLQLTAPYNLPLTEQQASISLFANQNPTQTISIILESLSHVTEQSVYYNESIPRLYYLLALSYELTNDQTNAVATYWQLWQSFPTSPYALIAQAKLQ